jgi:hypothetical protein
MDGKITSISSDEFYLRCGANTCFGRANRLTIGARRRTVAFNSVGRWP